MILHGNLIFFFCLFLTFLSIIPFTSTLLICSGLTWTTRSRLPTQAGTKKVFLTCSNWCCWGASEWIVCTVPSPTLSRGGWESSMSPLPWSVWRAYMTSPPPSLPLCSSWVQGLILLVSWANWQSQRAMVETGLNSLQWDRDKRRWVHLE